MSKFKKTLEHLDKGEYEKASKEMLNSKWATQTNKRAVHLSSIISGLKGKY